MSEHPTPPSPGSRPTAAPTNASAWRIAAAYAVFAILWIYLSDSVLALLVPRLELYATLSLSKGLAFVAVTSSLLLILMRRAFHQADESYAVLRRREQQLHSSEQHLSILIGCAMDAIITADAWGHIILFNEAAERMFGIAVSEALGRPLRNFLPAWDDKNDTAHLTLEGARQGKTFPLEVSVSRFDSGEGKMTTLILRDITQRLAQENEIKRFNRLYAALSQINQSIVWSSTREELFEKVCHTLVDHGGFCLAWIGWHDPATQRILPVAQWGGMEDYVDNLDIYTDERPQGSGPCGIAFREGRPYISNNINQDALLVPWRDDMMHRNLNATAIFPIQVRDKVQGLLNVYSVTPDFFQDREIALLVEAVIDISYALDNYARIEEHRKAEEVVLSEKQFSDTMIESMPGILYFYDEQGRFLRWNNNFETVSGYSAEEISTMTPLDFFRSEERALLQERIGEVFNLGDSFVEAPFLSKDGTLTPYFFTGRRLEFEGQTCLVGVGIDISARKKAETELLELNETLEEKVKLRTEELRVALLRAEAADKLKSAFLATMSHELRTPLNSIIGFTGIVLQGLAGPLNEEQSKQLGMVRNSARHLLELINDVLDISKIEAGQLEVRREPFDLAASIARSVDVVRPMAEKKEIEIKTDLLSDIGVISGDRRRVEQILINLLNNAVKFSDHGCIELTALKGEFAIGEKLPAPAVRLWVKDEGIGIQREDMDKLFQPFRQVDCGLSRQHEGTGLGLAICQRLVELMEGEITVHSEWGHGSEFAVTLPCNEPA